jgi:hypothetical protein
MGWAITSVTHDSAAMHAHIEVGEIIVSINQTTVSRMVERDVLKALNQVGGTIDLEVQKSVTGASAMSMSEIEKKQNDCLMPPPGGELEEGLCIVCLEKKADMAVFSS